MSTYARTDALVILQMISLAIENGHCMIAGRLMSSERRIAEDCLEQWPHFRYGFDSLTPLIDVLGINEGGFSDPRPDPRTNPEFWTE